ncbi:MAG: glycosyltransferase family 4 protein [Candidatus Binataceae bacterium]
MKILYLNPAGHLGGAERVLLDLMAGMREAKSDWRLDLVTAMDGALVTAAREIGVAVTVAAFPRPLARLGDAGAGGPAGSQMGLWKVCGRLGAAAPMVGGYLRRLRRTIAESAPDVVHTNGFKMHLLGVWATPRATPVLWHLHDYVRMRPMMSRLLRLHARRCAAVVANSRSVAADARAALGADVRMFTVYNAVDLARFNPDGSRLDLDALAGMAPLAAGGVRVGLPATMARWKGHETFLHAIAALPRDTPVRGYVIGGPLYQTTGSQYQIDELRAIAGRLGIGDRVGFTGFVDDAASALRALDIVVHASTQPEPFGLVIAEAMACGRAVIASAGGGAAEIISPGVNALDHAPGDAAALAARIAELAASPGERQRLGTAAFRFAGQRFSRARLATEMTPVYRGLA